MKKYCRHVSGFFSNRDQAEAICSTLVNSGIDKEQLTLRRTNLVSNLSGDTDGITTAMLTSIMGTIVTGTAIGAVIGVTAGLALNPVDAYSATPLITPMILIGWGASMGAFIGAVIGAKQKNQHLTKMGEETILYRQFTVIVETHDRQQTSTVKSIMDVAAEKSKNRRNNIIG
jgi:LytS/YehU family sensor histidine kinase